MSMLPTFNSDEYKDGRTKQSFKDATDINKILSKAQKTGTVSHLAKHEGVYGDFSDIDDLMTAHERLQRGQQIFDELPGEVRREFNQSPAEFFNFVNDPKNAGQLHKVLPALAKPGDQRPDVLKKAAQATGGATIQENGGAGGTPPAQTSEKPVEGDTGGSTA